MAKTTAAASSNIYTILAFAALVALLAGIIYMIIRLNELGISPFKYPVTALGDLHETARAIGLA